MKHKLLSIVLFLIALLILGNVSVYARVNHDEIKAIWISTVHNIDYPSVNSKNNPTAQKQEYIRILDKLQEIGINTVFVQVRPKADAFYESSINPWSDILTGVQGKHPGYDPLEFMIEEAHKRNMELHAWLNPYRITTSGTNLNALASTHPARLNPDWVIKYDNKMYYNPALEEVQQHIVDTVAEIILKYDVDGIHFDDYFYPSNYPLPAGEGRDGAVANARRQDINKMVQKVSAMIKKIDSTVEFGISPIGIWRNKQSTPLGSNTTGGEGYYTVFADAKAWIENEWIDYIIPQIYWEIGHAKADYATLVEWWSNLVKGTGVDLYIGQGIYKDLIAEQIIRQLSFNEKFPEVKGNAFFSLKDLMSNRKGVATSLKNYYSGNVQKQPSYNIGRVTASVLNVRKGPSTSYPIVSKLVSGTTIQVVEDLVEWFKIITSNGTAGYVHKDYVSIIK